MNKANYKRQATYPISTDGLDFIQNQILMLQKLTQVVGAKYIIKQSSSTTEGICVIDGELLPLTGAPAAYIKIVSTYSNDVTVGGVTYTQMRETRVAQYTNSSSGATAASAFTVVGGSGLLTMIAGKALANHDHETIGGNAATSTKLATARTINIQDASGTNTGTAASFDGSANAIVKLPSTIKATLTGNASTATTAGKLTSAVSIGSASFDGSSSITLAQMGVNIGSNANNIPLLGVSFGSQDGGHVLIDNGGKISMNTSNIGNATKPVYISGGKIVACNAYPTYTIPPGSYYGTSASTTAAQSVDCTGFVLATGATVLVKHTVACQGVTSLNVGGSGAKSVIKIQGVTSNAVSANTWHRYTYDGTNWLMEN